MPNTPDELPAPLRIGFVGAGRMAQALVTGIAANGMTNAVRFLDPDDGAARQFQASLPVACRQAEMSGLLDASDMLLLAVKPQIMPAVLEEMQSSLTAQHLVVSLAAGVPIRQLTEGLHSTRVVRVMPNTPCLIGKGISAVACHPAVPHTDRQKVEQLLAAVGQVVSVDEIQMDAVTGLSGSGPAYVFTFVEALIQGGEAQGLSADLARQLAIQTVLGATELLHTTGQTADSLRRQVTSPGGTTLAGLQTLSAHGFAFAVTEAIRAATERSRQLSEPGEE